LKATAKGPVKAVLVAITIAALAFYGWISPFEIPRLVNYLIAALILGLVFLLIEGIKGRMEVGVED